MASAGAKWTAAGGDYRTCRMVLAAQRRAGADFDEAWTLALKMISRDDRAILKGTRAVWHRAYNREPLYSGRAFSTMAGITDGETETRQTQLVM